MEQESIGLLLLMLSIKERMVFLIITGEHWDGIQFRFRPSHPVVLCSL